MRWQIRTEFGGPGEKGRQAWVYAGSWTTGRFAACVVGVGVLCVGVGTRRTAWDTLQRDASQRDVCIVWRSEHTGSGETEQRLPSWGEGNSGNHKRGAGAHLAASNHSTPRDARRQREATRAGGQPPSCGPTPTKHTSATNTRSAPPTTAICLLMSFDVWGGGRGCLRPHPLMRMGEWGLCLPRLDSSCPVA